MRHPPTLLAPALLLALAWLPGPARAQEADAPLDPLPPLTDVEVPLPPRAVPTLAAAAAELEGVQAKLTELRREVLEKRTAMQDRLRGIVREKQSVSRSLQFYKDDLARKEKDLQKRREDLEAKKASLAELKKPTEGIAPILEGYLSKVQELVKAGIPWKVEERSSTLRQAIEIVKAEGAAPGPSLQIVGRIQQEEEALGRLVESSAEVVEVSGEQKAVQAFHLGLLAVIFANDDGSILGFAQAGETLEDGIGSVAGHPDAEDGYLVAVDILRRRRTPALVDLYLPALPVTEGDE